jgi:hypothetical protein
MTYTVVETYPANRAAVPKLVLARILPAATLLLLLLLLQIRQRRCAGACYW